MLNYTPIQRSWGVRGMVVIDMQWIIYVPWTQIHFWSIFSHILSTWHWHLVSTRTRGYIKYMPSGSVYLSSRSQAKVKIENSFGKFRKLYFHILLSVLHIIREWHKSLPFKTMCRIYYPDLYVQGEGHCLVSLKWNICFWKITSPCILCQICTKGHHNKMMWYVYDPSQYVQGEGLIGQGQKECLFPEHNFRCNFQYVHLKGDGNPDYYSVLYERSY